LYLVLCEAEAKAALERFNAERAAAAEREQYLTIKEARLAGEREVSIDACVPVPPC
jgi:hypothetical protein